MTKAKLMGTFQHHAAQETDRSSPVFGKPCVWFGSKFIAEARDMRMAEVIAESLNSLQDGLKLARMVISTLGMRDQENGLDSDDRELLALARSIIKSVEGE